MFEQSSVYKREQQVDIVSFSKGRGFCSTNLSGKYSLQNWTLREGYDIGGFTELTKKLSYGTLEESSLIGEGF
jgi:hypothetical protein